MKHVSLLLTLMLAACGSYAQSVDLPRDNVTGEVQFREVVTVDPALDPKTIMQRARTWVATAYRSANDVVQQYDAEAAVLIVKGNFAMTRKTESRYWTGTERTSVPVQIRHTLTVEAKPGRYRVTIDGFSLSSGGTDDNPMPTSNQRLMADLKDNCESMLKSLKNSVLNPEKDW